MDNSRALLKNPSSIALWVRDSQEQTNWNKIKIIQIFARTFATGSANITVLVSFQGTIPGFQNVIPGFQSVIPGFLSAIPCFRGAIPGFQGAIPGFRVFKIQFRVFKV